MSLQQTTASGIRAFIVLKLFLGKIFTMCKIHLNRAPRFKAFGSLMAFNKNENISFLFPSVNFLQLSEFEPTITSNNLKNSNN